MAIGVVSASVFLLLEPFLQIGWQKLTDFYSKPSESLLPIFIAGLIFVLSRVGLKRFYAFMGFKNFWSYPPLWVSAIVGTLLIALHIAFFNRSVPLFGVVQADTRELLPITGYVIVFVVIALCIAFNLSKVFERKARSRIVPIDAPVTEGKCELFDNFDTLMNWFSTDEPVEAPDFDCFDHKKIAKRILSRLLDNGNKVWPTVAVVGQLGTGKTTIFHLFEYFLSKRRERTIKAIRVSVWPFEQPDAAVTACLNALIQGLQDEVNTLGIKEIPREYVELIGKTPGLWGSIATVLNLHQHRDPRTLLKRFNDVAVAIGVHYVLWIEDLERYESSEPRGSKSQPRTGKLKEIHALLYLLNELSNVHVVLASTSLYNRFDIDKIARYIETIPRPGRAQVSKILQRFREGCFLKLEEKYDPAEPKDREDLNRLANVGDPLWDEFFSRYVTSIEVILPSLCSTPRRLKMAVRECFETWSVLVGEIDFDDLLSITLLKHAIPDAFAFVTDNIDLLRRNKRENSKDVDKKLAKVVINSDERQLVSTVLSFIFPYYGRKSDREKKQGLATVAPHTDYWERYRTLPGFEDESRDQFVIASWRQGTDEDIIRLLSNSDRHWGAEYFSTEETLERLFRILGGILDKNILEDPRIWRDESAPGLVPIWRLLNDRYKLDDEYSKELMDVLRPRVVRSVKENLQLAIDIEHYFAATTGNVPELLVGLTEDFRGELKAIVRNGLQDTDTWKPEKIAVEFERYSPFVLHRAVWGLDRINSGNTGGIPFEGWEEVADSIKKAARINRTAVLSQVSLLIVQETFDQGAPSRKRLAYDKERGERLFGHEWIMNVFSVATPIESQSGMYAPYNIVIEVAIAARGNQ